MSSAETARRNGLRVNAQVIPVPIPIDSVLRGEPGGLGERRAVELDRPDALDARRLGRGRTVGKLLRGVAEGDYLDSVERVSQRTH